MAARQTNPTQPPEEGHCRNDKALMILLVDAEGALIDQITAASPDVAPQKACDMLHRREQLCVGWRMEVHAPVPDFGPMAPRETD
jgi:hypothetical protein